MRNPIFFFALGALGCGTGSPPPPVAPVNVESWCRCNAPDWPLAVVRVDSEPVAFTDSRDPPVMTGMEFDVVVEGTLPSGSSGLSVPAPASRVRVRQYIANAQGNPVLAATDWSHPQYTHVVLGQRVVTRIQGVDPDVSNRYSIGIVGTVSAAGTLSQKVYSFPIGTPAEQVTDPVQWTCTTSSPQLGECSSSDAGGI